MKFVDNKKAKWPFAVFLVVLLIQSQISLAAITVTGDVNLSTYANQADSFTNLQWSYFDLTNVSQVRAYAEIKLNYSVVGTDTETCQKFYPDTSQQCIAIASANSCTEGCPYTGSGIGEKKLGMLPIWPDIGDWGEVTRICQSGEGN